MSMFHRTRHDESTDEHVDRDERVDTDEPVDRDEPVDTRTDESVRHTETRVVDDEAAHDRFGGINWGSAFFGWLVAIGMTVLLAGIVAAITSAVGANTGFTLDEAEREAETVGLVGAIAAVVILALAFCAGGYVAGRMSRFDGGRQGVGVWAIGLLITIVAGLVGWIFGSEYNLLDRLDMPDVDLNISTDIAAIGGIVAGIVVLLVTLVAAMTGGKLGERYHHRVDDARYV